MAIRQFLGNLVDKVGTAFGGKERGWSEWIAGRGTDNTNTKPLAGTDAYLDLNPDGSFAGGKQQYVQRSVPQAQPVRDGEQIAQEMRDAGWGNANTFAEIGNGGSTPAPTGGTSAPERPDRSNSILANEAALRGADTQLSSGMAAIQETLDKLMGRYSEEATANEKNYGSQSTTNKNNLLRNTQAALLNAAQGRRGLFGVLASIGALSGSGIDLANRAVQQGANADISGANDTFGENQSSLDENIGLFRDADRRRREEAESGTENSRLDLRNQVATNRQKIYSSLADDYSQMGDEARAREYAELVASLFPEIAATSVPKASVGYSSAAYAPSTLAKYVGGDTGTQVRTTPAGGETSLPGLIAVNPLERRKRED